MERVRGRLISWSWKVKDRCVALKKELSCKLEVLTEEDRDDENLAELIDIKFS